MRQFFAGHRARVAVFAVVLAASFLAGYGVVGHAWPGVPDRNPFHGYFSGTPDTFGDKVIQNGYPNWVNNADSFIAFVKDRLYNGPARDRVGAAFTIQTMRGANGGWSRNFPPTAFEMADWESAVRYAESRGWISWYQNFTYTGNSYWQGCCGGGSNPNDDAFYYQNGTRLSMVFRNSSGVAYVIKRDCGNPLTFGYMPGLDSYWQGDGRTTVSKPLAVPGETVTFSHYTRNVGQTAGQWFWNTYNSRTGAWLASGGLDIYNPGQERNVNNENFTIPANAAANQKYCRQVGWFWASSSNHGEGRAGETCVTVYIPAKIKAVMTANPATIIAGDTTVFTPSISVQSAGNPVDVNCTIVRVVIPPSGGPSNLGNQPCVDPATGSPNFTVSGGGKTLKTNSYTAPDNIPVGAKVCDTITITNPALPVFFNSPADRTATFCVTIAKTPYVRFMGNDVFAGGNFAAVNAACNTGANITTVGRTLSDGSGAGSVGEYGVFALGTTATGTGKITGFGSASKALIGSGALGGPGRMLTFANSEPDATKLGYFGAPQHCIPDYITQFGSAANLAVGTYNVGGRGSGQWHVAGTLTLSGTMPAGGQQVYYADGDITISADLKYPANYAGVGNIPSLVVITKGNIRVASNVAQMDGIYQARGNGTTSGVFYTCWPKNEPASITNACNNTALTVNGSVAAAKIDLFRSFGATGVTPAARKDAGEQFMFSPEMYLRNVINTTGQMTVQTTTTLELPPRF